MAVELVVGLGNPGPEYEATRHNVGFRAVEELAARLRVGAWRRAHHSLVASGEVRGRRVVVARPLTFMNLSGDAVSSLCDGFDVRPSRLLVVYDDVDLPLGRLRLKPSGGPGTHNGMRSIVSAIGPGFPRLRLGVAGDHPPRDLAGWVLSPFDPEEEAVAERLVTAGAAAALDVLHSGLQSSMNRYNRAPLNEG